LVVDLAQEVTSVADYHRVIDVQVSADQAFAFVADIANLPRFVPTTRRAGAEQGQVHVDGVAGGRPYHDDGQIYIDADQRVMRWGSGASGYRGELSISESSDRQARIEINLHFRDGDAHTPDRQQIEQSLDASVQRLHDELSQG
jgi:Polyketide cyclase / dehydrase and lipid transport